MLMQKVEIPLEKLKHKGGIVYYWITIFVSQDTPLPPLVLMNLNM